MSAQNDPPEVVEPGKGPVSSTPGATCGCVGPTSGCRECYHRTPELQGMRGHLFRLGGGFADSVVMQCRTPRGWRGWGHASPEGPRWVPLVVLVAGGTGG